MSLESKVQKVAKGKASAEKKHYDDKGHVLVPITIAPLKGAPKRGFLCPMCEAIGLRHEIVD